MRHRRDLVLAVSVLGLLTLAVRHPTADFQLDLREAGDPAPHRMQAAVDLGLVGVSVLYTWTVKRLN